MNIWRGMARLAARAAGGLERLALPPGGRSSQEPAQNLDGAVQALSGYYGGLLPYSPAVLALLESLALHSPVISQACKLIASTVNTGHSLELQGPESQVNAARDLLGELAARIYPRSAGADGLVNHYARQLAVSGAIASEDVLEPDLSALRQVAILPAAGIRFKWQEADWRAYQHTSAGQELLLAPATFAYYALDTLPGHPPYAVPPFVSAIGPEELQRDFLKNLRQYARKVGIYGLTTVKVPAPDRQPGESEPEYQQRAQDHIQRVAAVYDSIIASGLLVMPDSHEVEHKPVTSSAAGVDKINQGVEQLLMSALNIDPAMFGRSFSTTETYAGVVYGLLLRSAAQYQRLIKRRMERSYRLALLLAGLFQVDVALNFNPQPELNKQQAAEAEQTRQSMVLERLNAGIIDADQAARELGYEKAAAPGLARAASSSQTARGGEQTLRLVLSLEPGGRDYQPARLSLGKPPDEDEAAERAIQAEAGAKAARYAEELSPLAARVRQAALEALEALLAGAELGQDLFVERAYQALAQEYAQGWAAPEVREVVRQTLEPIYKNFRQAADLAGAGPRAWTWGGPEQRVLDFSATQDNFYLSKYITNHDAQRKAMRALREQWLERGVGLFGQADLQALAAFRAAVGGALADVDSAQIRTIVDTSVMRLRNWAAVQQLSEAGVTWGQIWAVLDGKTTAICREMHGRVFRVAAAAAEVATLAAMSPGDFAAHIGPIKPETVRTEGLAGLQARGQLLPPYHPNCRTRVKMALEPPTVTSPPEGLGEDQQRAWKYWQELGPAAQRFRLTDAAQSEWSSAQKELDHLRSHPELGSTLAEYRGNVADIKGGYNRALFRKFPDGKMEIALVRGGENDWRLAIIDPVGRTASEAAMLRTAYGPKLRRPVTWAVKMQGMASRGWVEVTS